MVSTYAKKIMRNYYSDSEFIDMLWWSQVVSPIMTYNEWICIPLKDIHSYLDKTLYSNIFTSEKVWSGMNYFVDAKGSRYNVTLKKLEELWIWTDKIRNFRFEVVERIEDEGVDFNKMKEELVDIIVKEWKEHPYYDVKEKIALAKSFEELMELMDSVPH